jgi:tetratricopeptide (TPR) repeat protein
LEDAVACFRDAIAIREQLVREYPENVSYQRDLMVGYGTLGDVLGFQTGMNLGDTAGALAAFRKAFEIAQWLTEQDPADRKAKFDLFSASLRLGSLMADDPQQVAAGLRLLQQTEGIIAPLLAEDPMNARFLYNAAYLERRIGFGLAETGREPAAVRRLEHASTALARVVDGPLGPAARLNMTLANARLASLGVPEARTLELAESAERELGKVPVQVRSPWLEAAVYQDLGHAYRRIGRLDRAAACLEKSRASLVGVKAPPSLEAKRRTLLASVQADLAAVAASRPASQ